MVVVVGGGGKPRAQCTFIAINHKYCHNMYVFFNDELCNKWQSRASWDDRTVVFKLFMFCEALEKALDGIKDPALSFRTQLFTNPYL